MKADEKSIREPRSKRLRPVNRPSVVSALIQLVGSDTPPVGITTKRKTIGLVDLPPPLSTSADLVEPSSVADAFEQDARDEDARTAEGELTPMDRAWVARTAMLIRERDLDNTDRQAAVIADAVVAKLREAPREPMGPERVFIDTAEAAAILGISRAAFDKRVQRRQVPGVVRTAGRHIQIDKAKMLAGLAKRGR